MAIEETILRGIIAIAKTNYLVGFSSHEAFILRGTTVLLSDYVYQAQHGYITCMENSSQNPQLLRPLTILGKEFWGL